MGGALNQLQIEGPMNIGTTNIPLFGDSGCCRFGRAYGYRLSLSKLTVLSKCLNEEESEWVITSIKVFIN